MHATIFAAHFTPTVRILDATLMHHACKAGRLFCATTKTNFCNSYLRLRIFFKPYCCLLGEFFIHLFEALVIGVTKRPVEGPFNKIVLSTDPFNIVTTDIRIR